VLNEKNPQDSQPLMACNLKNECPAPNFGDATAPGAPVAKPQQSSVKKANSVNFLVKPEEKRKYDTLFDQLQPVDDRLPGDKVKSIENESPIVINALSYISNEISAIGATSDDGL